MPRPHDANAQGVARQQISLQEKNARGIVNFAQYSRIRLVVLAENVDAMLRTLGRA